MKRMNRELESTVSDFAAQLVRACEAFVEKRVAGEIAATSAGTKAQRLRRPATKRKLSYYPGCKNVAAPRFGMFCAAVPKDLPKRQKNEIRAKRK
jgi:hypothetical protein